MALKRRPRIKPSLRDEEMHSFVRKDVGKDKEMHSLVRKDVGNDKGSGYSHSSDSSPQDIDIFSCESFDGFVGCGFVGYEDV